MATQDSLYLLSPKTLLSDPDQRWPGYDTMSTPRRFDFALYHNLGSFPS